MLEHTYFRHLLRPSKKQYLLGLALFAFLLRFGVVVGLRDISKFHGPGPAGSDAVEFNAIALNLASGNGYSILPARPTTLRAPGFPLLLAALYSVSYENYALVYIALCVVGTLTCLLTYGIAREIMTEGPARIAGLFAAVYLPHIYFSTVFLSENVFALCVAVASYFLLQYLRTSSVWQLAGVGIGIGYAALSRPVAVLFLPLLALVLLLRQPGGNHWRLFQQAAVMLTAAGLVILPWSFRNYTVYHRLVLIAANGGSTFYGSNNDVVLHQRHYAGSWISTVNLPGRTLIDAAPDELTRDQAEWNLGKQWVSAHMADLPLLSWYKVVRFWLPDLTSENPKFVWMQVAGYTPFAIMILLGVAASLRPFKAMMSSAWLVLHALLAANLLCSLMFYGSARFRDGISPVLMVYAALGMDLLLRRADRKAAA